MAETISQQRNWSPIAFMAGLIQVIIVLALLFLPTPLTCILGKEVCEPHGLLPFATTTTFVIFALVGLLGAGVICSSYDQVVGRRVSIRWIAAGLMTLVTLMGIFGA